MKHARPGMQVRGPYQGALQILSFNRRFYTGTIFGALATVTAALIAPLSPEVKWVLATGALVALFWLILSLVVSHWVYDRSDIYRWNWLTECVASEPKCWVNIHAGLDESSVDISSRFPNSQGTILDIFDNTEMTEESIAQARSASRETLPALHADFRALPLTSQSVDVVFLLFAAHEIRHARPRMEFFVELNRILRDSGTVILMEHMRDWKNFIAYGPGFFHFHSRKTWGDAIAWAGLSLEKEINITPFVRLFQLRKSP